MSAPGIALESVMKLFCDGTISQKLCKHTDGRFNKQTLAPVDCDRYHASFWQITLGHAVGQMTLSY